MIECINTFQELRLLSLSINYLFWELKKGRAAEEDVEEVTSRTNQNIIFLDFRDAFEFAFATNLSAGLYRPLWPFFSFLTRFAELGAAG